MESGTGPAGIAKRTERNGQQAGLKRHKCNCQAIYEYCPPYKYFAVTPEYPPIKHSSSSSRKVQYELKPSQNSH